MLYVMNDCSTIAYIVYLFSWLELYARYDGQVMDLNTHRNLFSIGHFMHAYIHVSKTTGRMWRFYVLNDCSVGDVYFLH